MEIELGAVYEVTTGTGGRFTARADRLMGNGFAVVLIPTRRPVREVFPDGYQLGRAHWDANLKRVH